MQKCLQSLDLTSQACQKVLADVDLLTSLKKKCTKPQYTSNPVCTVLNTVPDVPLDELGDLLGSLLGGVLGRTTPPNPSTRALYGGSP